MVKLRRRFSEEANVGTISAPRNSCVVGLVPYNLLVVSCVEHKHRSLRCKRCVVTQGELIHDLADSLDINKSVLALDELTRLEGLVRVPEHHLIDTVLARVRNSLSACISQLLVQRTLNLWVCLRKADSTVDNDTSAKRAIQEVERHCRVRGSAAKRPSGNIEFGGIDMLHSRSPAVRNRTARVTMSDSLDLLCPFDFLKLEDSAHRIQYSLTLLNTCRECTVRTLVIR